MSYRVMWKRSRLFRRAGSALAIAVAVVLTAVLVISSLQPVAVSASNDYISIGISKDSRVQFDSIDIYPAPLTFDAEQTGDSQVLLTWTKPTGALNVMVRAKFGSPPVDRNDGYLVYYGTATSYTDTPADFDETAGRLYYRAWAEYTGGAWSIPAEDFVEGNGMTLLALVVLAVGLTVAMFMTKNALLGFPSVIFWAILGAFAYIESTTPWGDWQYFLAFGSFGMVIFSAYAGYALREKRDTLADIEFEHGEPRHYIDEEPEPKRKHTRSKTSEQRNNDNDNWLEDDGIPDDITQAYKERPGERRRYFRRRKDEFDF